MFSGFRRFFSYRADADSQGVFGIRCRIEQIANRAMYLLSDKSPRSTGALLDACGGRAGP